MFEQIDPRSPNPLYAQIATRLRWAIASGELAPGKALPSVRQLAATLRVNPATVVQAYRDLETEGFVELRQGAGTFVRDVSTDKRAAERSREAIRLVRSMVAEAGKLGIQKSDLMDAVRQELGGKVP